jgi:hypothetical protein
MTALTDALAAAQAKAIAALGKRYVADVTASDDVTDYPALLAGIGCADEVEQAQLLAAWQILRETGTAAPTETRPGATGAPEEPRKTSKAQLDLIAKLVREKGLEPPDEPQNLLLEQASQMISAMRQGTYKADDYKVPF